MMRTLGIASVALALVATLAGSARAGEERHTSLTDFDACLPLEDGRLLAASGGGLVLVNEENQVSKVFTALDGLPATRVHSLAVANDGIWVGTERGAALVSLRDSQLSVHKRVKSKAVRDILVRGDELYLGTWGQGVLKVVGNELRRLPRSKRSWTHRVTSLAWHEGRLWWGSAGKGLWSQSARGVKRSSDVPSKELVWDLRSEGDSLWIATDQAVLRKSDALRSFPMFGVRALLPAKEGMLAASFGAGLRSLESPTMIGPETPFLRSAARRGERSCAGGQRSLWVADKGEWSEVQLPESLPSSDISALALHGGKVAIGTFDHGVAILEDGDVRELELRMDPNINALAWDALDGSLWIATSAGLAKWSEKGLERYGKSEGLPSRHVMSLDALPSGGVLVGTAAGAATVIGDDVTALGGKGGLGTGNVWAVAHGADGSFWLGTTRGLWRLRGDHVDRFRLASGHLPEDWIMALEATNTGLFVGTYKSGVLRFDVAGNEVSSTQLGKGWVNPGGLHWDGSTLHVATMHGSLRGNGQSSSWQQGPQGLGRDTTAYLPDGQGGHWLATRRGLLHRGRTQLHK